ncbi:hypothetical protein BpHYR1_021904 [Brachionus plicatilis]|uniref:Uncharacterized protein n=1 Tax=Brachionus plicatilis TaxID=10195 RepID=A0A3M7PRM5_BRAPC|nr:hypothetical protein BpHYR1_021904 [Brachionus plicatilis]
MENDPKTVSNESVLMNPDDDTLVDAENVVKETNKRRNKRAKTVEVEANSENANVNCKKCNEPMKKRRHYYCINKCTQD